MKAISFGPAPHPFRCAAKPGALSVSRNETAGTVDLVLVSDGGARLVVRLSGHEEMLAFGRDFLAACEPRSDGASGEVSP